MLMIGVVAAQLGSAGGRKITDLIVCVSQLTKLSSQTFKTDPVRVGLI